MSARVSELWLAGQSDDRLVALARAGNDRAFEAIVARYQRELRRAAERRDREGRAEDVVQQTFLSAFTALRAGAEVRHLRGWLHQILRHVAARTPAPDATPSSAHVAGTAASAHEIVELRLLIAGAMAAIAQLPRRQQQALVQFAIHGRTRAEVAGAMGLSEGAVRQLVHRARQTLRGAAAVAVPYPLARLLALRPARPPVPAEAGAGAAAGSAGGLAVKVGGLMAAAAVSTGVAGFIVRRERVHAPARPKGSAAWVVVRRAVVRPVHPSLRRPRPILITTVVSSRATVPVRTQAIAPALRTRPESVPARREVMRRPSERGDASPDGDRRTASWGADGSVSGDGGDSSWSRDSRARDLSG